MPRAPLLLVAALTCAGCIPSAPAPPATEVSPATSTPSATAPALPAPAGWTTLSNEEVGFTFAYPGSGLLSSESTAMPVRILFPPDPGTNVVDEILTISGTRGAAVCISPLAEGWAPGDLSPETVALNGVVFLRQTHSGVAAGTSSTWVAYTTQRDDRCVSLGYELRTFDPANLDPTVFPTPPGKVDLAERIRAFETMVATFAWRD